MAAWTTDDVYGGDMQAEDPDYGLAQGFSPDGMAGVTLNGTHTVEQSGKHVAMLALAAVVVLVVLNRAGIHATVAAGR